MNLPIKALGQSNWNDIWPRFPRRLDPVVNTIFKVWHVCHVCHVPWAPMATDTKFLLSILTCIFELYYSGIILSNYQIFDCLDMVITPMRYSKYSKTFYCPLIYWNHPLSDDIIRLGALNLHSNQRGAWSEQISLTKGFRFESRRSYLSVSEHHLTVDPAVHRVVE